MMHRHSETMKAVTRDLYERVAYHKSVFGAGSEVRRAPENGIRLVPEGKVLEELEADYRDMQPMFFTEPPAPPFAEVLAELAGLQEALQAL